MQTQTQAFIVTAALVAAGLLGPFPAAAQRAGQDGPVDGQGAAWQGTASWQGGNPPAVVGRLARIHGTVSLHTPDATQWRAATPNYPVTAGNAFWTQPGAEAEIDIAAARLALAGGTELDIDRLDATGLEVTLPQGALYLRLRAVAPGARYTLLTPRGAVTLRTPGRYAVVAGDTEAPTLVTVLDGAASVTGEGVALTVGPEQTAVLTGTETLQGTLGPAQRDAFLVAMLAREQPARGTGAPPPVVAVMPGGEELAACGAWETVPGDGPVWYPPVAAGWVPYRDGHWAYVAPWGWTWIDDAPWGFAPSHYGRWVLHGERWGWTPGVAVVADPAPPPPVYAPALVTFFGVGAGMALAAGSIGWYPLGPHEVYHPWYQASPAYIQQINRGSVTTVTEIDRPVPFNPAANPGGATVVPASALQTSQPIGPLARPAGPALLAAAHPLTGQLPNGQLSTGQPPAGQPPAGQPPAGQPPAGRLLPGQFPLAPTAATAGVTPAVARQFGLPGVPYPAAPGPAIHQPAPGSGPAHLPPLAGPPGTPLQTPVAGSAGMPHPLPTLRTPGAALRGPPPIESSPGAFSHPGPVAGPSVAAPGESPLARPAGPASVHPGSPVASRPAGPEPAASGAPLHQPEATAHAAAPVASEIHAPEAAHAAVTGAPAPQAHAQPQMSAPAAPHVAGVSGLHEPARPQVHAAPPFHAPAPVHFDRPQAPQFHAPSPVAHVASPQFHPAPQPHGHAGPPPHEEKRPNEH